jgi:hypothetical protein
MNFLLHGISFQRLDQKVNAERFERGCRKITHENLTGWTLSGREKPPNANFEGGLKVKLPRFSPSNRLSRLPQNC